MDFEGIRVPSSPGAMGQSLRRRLTAYSLEYNVQGAIPPSPPVATPPGGPRQTMDFDQLLLHVGEFGKGQLVVLLAASVGWGTLAMAVLSMVFVSQTPAWSCSSADDDTCQQLMRQQDPSTGLCKLHAGQYMWDNPNSSLVSSFGLVCNNSWKLSLANSTFFIGFAMGSLLFGWLADRRGRRCALIYSSLANAGATLLCAVSPTFSSYVLARAVQGVCCSGIPTSAYVLSTESVGPTYRGRAGTASQLVYHVGEWLLPLLALLLQDWRLLYVTVAACSLATAALASWVPESPRWQLLHGRQPQAVSTLHWLARMNGRELPAAAVQQLLSGTHKAAAAVRCKDTAITAVEADDVVVGELLRGQEHLERDVLLKTDQHTGLDSCGQTAMAQEDQQLLQPAMNPAGKGGKGQPEQPAHSSDSLWMILADPLLARFFWVSAWFCTSMAAAFFTTNLATEELKGSLYVTFLLTSIGELPATLIGAVALDYWGRRPTIATGLLVTGAACCVCSLLRSGPASTALASLGKASCSSTWSLSYVYAAELMPTTVRSATMAVSNQAARLAGVAAPFIVYAGEQLGLPKLPFAVVGIVSACSALMAGLVPETLGQRQPDTMTDLHNMYGRGGTGSGRCSQGKGSTAAAGSMQTGGSSFDSVVVNAEDDTGAGGDLELQGVPSAVKLVIAPSSHLGFS